MPYFDGWTNRIKITLPASKVDSDVLNPVVPVKLSATALSELHSVLGSGDTNRKKCAFTSLTGTYYYAEIKEWLTGTFFVGTATLSSAVDNEFYLYANPSASDSAYMGDAGDAAGQTAWGSSAVSVWNFEQDPTGGAGCILDSKGSYDGTPSGTMTADDLVASQFGNGLQLDGTDDYISFGSNALGITGNYSLFALVKFEEDGSNTERIFAKQNGGYSFALSRQNAFATNGKIVWELSTNGSLPYDTSYSQGVIAQNATALLSIVYNGSNVKLYVDETEDTGGYFPRTATSPFYDTTNELRVGSSATYDAKLQGIVSHFSIHSTARPAEWIEVFSKGLDGSLLTFDPMQEADTIRERIIDGIVDNLEQIQISNGYATDCGDLVLRAEEIGSIDKLPAIALTPKQDEINDSVYGFDNLIMPIEIIAVSGYTFGASQDADKLTISQTAEQILGDIRKAMGLTLSLVESVDYVEGGILEYPEEKDNEISVVVRATYNINYETLKDDPYNQ